MTHCLPHAKWKMDFKNSPMNSVLLNIVVLILMLQLFSPLPCFSVETLNDELKNSSNPEIEDMLEEFENDNDDLPALSVEKSLEQKKKRSPVSLKSYFKQGMSYNYAHNKPLSGQSDWRGLSKLRSEIFSHIKVDVTDNIKAVVSGNIFYDSAYFINNRSDYTKQVLDAYEYELEFKEVYIQGNLLKNLDIKLGRQIIVWGTSDYIRVTDVLNPLDLREPGITDLEDLRLPLTMSRMDYYFENFNLTAIAVHEKRFNKNPVFGSDFYPFDIPLPREKHLENDWDNTEWAISFKAILDKWDISFYFAQIFNDSAHMVMENPLNNPTITMDHAKTNMAGTAMQVAYGNWLFKTEAAYFNGLRFFNQPYQTFARWDFLLGVEYFGFNETYISLEAVNRHINHFNSSLELFPDYALKNDFQVMLKISKDFLHDTLKLSFLGSIFGIDGRNGSFQRYTLEYLLTDHWSILTGIINYQSGDMIEMKKIGDNDRIFLNIKYSF